MACECSPSSLVSSPAKDSVRRSSAMRMVSVERVIRSIATSYRIRTPLEPVHDERPVGTQPTRDVPRTKYTRIPRRFRKGRAHTPEECSAQDGRRKYVWRRLGPRSRSHIICVARLGVFGTARTRCDRRGTSRRRGREYVCTRGSNGWADTRLVDASNAFGRSTTSSRVHHG